MKYLFHLPAVLLALLMCTAQLPAKAQGPATDSERTVLKVKGLDHAMRDALKVELEGTGLRLAYACVPAGILVLESDQLGTSAAVLSRSLSAMEKHSRSKDISVLPISLQEAESQCAQARNR